MAVETRTQIKTYFQTGDVPTENQFVNFIDSAQHVNDEIRLITVTGATTFTVPIGKTLTHLGIYCGANETIKIGTTGVGSDNLLYEQAVTVGKEIIISTAVWARLAAKTVYVTATNLTLHVREVIMSPLT